MNAEILTHVDKEGRKNDYMILGECGDYTILKRESSYLPYVTAKFFDRETVSWSYGNYFSDLVSASQYVANMTQESNEPDEKELLATQPYKIKGVELEMKDMINIASYYHKACTQEFVFENTPTEITQHDALRIATYMLDILADEDSGEWELMKDCMKKLGYEVAV